VPEDLGSRFDGDELSVGVALHEHGRIGCGYQPMLCKPRQKALHVSEHLLRRLTTPLCSSIRTWKFRPLRAFFVHPGSFRFLRFRIPVRTYLGVSERVARVVE
jgi:hypothetical protein